MGGNKRTELQVNERKCIHCDSKETEDEVHFLNKCFLNKCILFTNEHKLLYSKCSEHMHDFHIMNYNVVLRHVMASTE